MLLFKNLIKSNLLRFLENQRSCNRVIVHTNYQQNKIERNRLYLPFQQDTYFLLPYCDYYSSYLPFISGISILLLHLVSTLFLFIAKLDFS